jgi:hypothetical protein
MHQGSLTFSNLRNDFLLSKEFSNSSENASIADSFPETNGASVENINIFFDRLDDPALAGISITNFYNADEFGLFKGLGNNGLRVGKAYRKQITVKNAHDLQWITIIKCTRADEVVYPPLMSFAGKHVQQQ